MNPVEAVRKLRKHTQDSQQAFATRLGLSIRAIANYESDRQPTGRALTSLAHLAQSVGRDDLAKVFIEALAVEIGLHTHRARMLSQWVETKDGEKVLQGYLFMHLDGREEMEFAFAFYDLMGAFTTAIPAEFRASPEVKEIAGKLLRKFKATVDKEFDRSTTDKVRRKK